MLNIGDKVEVRKWYADEPVGNWRTWVGPWMKGEVHAIDKHGNVWVLFCHEGYHDADFFYPSDVRTV